MLGQVATLRARAHDSRRACTTGFVRRHGRLRERRPARGRGPRGDAGGAGRCRDRRGLAACARRARPRDFLGEHPRKVDAITEIPAHRWDWRLYFDADRQAKDKIYPSGAASSTPSRSIRCVRHAAEVHRCRRPDAADGAGGRASHAGRRRLPRHGPSTASAASAIIGASGGAGDFGMQYGLRAELPRFIGACRPRSCAPAARVDRGLLCRHPAQRDAGPHCQPAELRRHEPHHRRGLRLVARRGVPGRHRTGRRAQRLRDRRRRGLRCRSRSATCASARRRRSRRAGAADLRPGGDGIVISEGIAWSCSSGWPTPNATAIGSTP